MEKPIIIDGNLTVDDRGIVSFINDFSFKRVKRFYMVENHERGFIRAWHGHKNEAKYVLVVSGSILMGISKLDATSIDFPQKFILSSKKPSLLYIPPGYFNGFQSLEENTKIIFFSTSTLEESKDDDIRKEWRFWNIWDKNYR